MDTQKPWPPTFSAIPSHTRLSIDSLHQPTSKYTKRVRLNSFRVYVTFSSPTDTWKPWPPTFSAIPPHNWLSIHSLCQPTSKCMKRVHLNLFRVSVTISGCMDTWSPKTADTFSYIPLIPHIPSIPCINSPPNAWNEFVRTHFVFTWCFPALNIHENPRLPTFLAIPPHTQLSIDSLHQPTSKCKKRVQPNSFHVSVTISGPTHTRKPWPPTFSAIPPSYLTFHWFPASTHLQIHETSSFELVLCLRDVFQPYRYTKTMAADILSHTPS